MMIAKRTSDMFPTLWNDLFDFSFGGYAAKTPQMNIIENENDFVIEVNVPGLTKNDLALNIDADHNLVIEMVKTENKESNQQDADAKCRYLRREFGTMQFKESVALPKDIHIEQISAKVENGILSINLPKVTAEEKRKIAQMIEIQ